MKHLLTTLAHDLGLLDNNDRTKHIAQYAIFTHFSNIHGRWKCGFWDVASMCENYMQDNNWTSEYDITQEFVESVIAKIVEEFKVEFVEMLNPVEYLISGGDGGPQGLEGTGYLVIKIKGEFWKGEFWVNSYANIVNDTEFHPFVWTQVSPTEKEVTVYE